MTQINVVRSDAGAGGVVFTVETDVGM